MSSPLVEQEGPGSLLDDVLLGQAAHDRALLRYRADTLSRAFYKDRTLRVSPTALLLLRSRYWRLIPPPDELRALHRLAALPRDYELFRGPLMPSSNSTPSSPFDEIYSRFPKYEIYTPYPLESASSQPPDFLGFRCGAPMYDAL
ncbi:hypothetical protein DXG01_007274 [Tephrocybe rancida]|nr:hypothetical protein DXG01_007274 [Tephrocybe rancida]